MLDFEIVNRAGIGAFPAVLAGILPDLARMTRAAIRSRLSSGASRNLRRHGGAPVCSALI
jgi:hypothetical protein